MIEMETRKIYDTGWGALGYKSYDDYLVSDLWLEKRSFMMEAYPFCWLCKVEQPKKIMTRLYCRICKLKYSDYVSGVTFSSMKINHCQHKFIDYKIVGKPLIVHHINYSNVGNEHAEDLVVLCKECHEKVHKFVKWGRNF